MHPWVNLIRHTRRNRILPWGKPSGNFKRMRCHHVKEVRSAKVCMEFLGLIMKRQALSVSPLPRRLPSEDSQLHQRPDQSPLNCLPFSREAICDIYFSRRAFFCISSSFFSFFIFSYCCDLPPLQLSSFPSSILYFSFPSSPSSASCLKGSSSLSPVQFVVHSSLPSMIITETAVTTGIT